MINNFLIPENPKIILLYHLIDLCQLNVFVCHLVGITKKCVQRMRINEGIESMNVSAPRVKWLCNEDIVIERER